MWDCYFQRRYVCDICLTNSGMQRGPVDSVRDMRSAKIFRKTGRKMSGSKTRTGPCFAHAKQSSDHGISPFLKS